MAALLALLTASAAGAQDAGPKRTEGKYFVELAEIMLTSDQFDVHVATVDPAGPRTGAEATDVFATLGSTYVAPPRVTIGLNRPSGKTAISVTGFRAEMKDERIPVTFDDQSNVVTSPLLPAGIVFQREGAPPDTGGTGFGTEFVPNWGTEYSFIRRASLRQADFTLEHNVYENERFRLRWLGGLRYGEFDQSLAIGIAHAKEYGQSVVFFQGQASTRVVELQDFFFLQNKVNTHGFGPKAGLAGRFLLGGKKRWSIDASADLAFIPERTLATYGVRYFDASTEGPIVGSTRFVDGEESPIIPGIGASGNFSAFGALAKQDDFTEITMLGVLEAGIAFKPNDVFSVGLQFWQTRWNNVLSGDGMITTVGEQGTYRLLPGRPGDPDPGLRQTLTLIDVPRFSERDDFVFDGVSLELKFDF